MASKKMIKSLNEQLNAELYSAYLYYSMSAYFEARNLKGAAHWFRTQAQEELFHASKFYDYIHDRDGEVKLTQIDAPKTQWKSLQEAFNDAYEHEQSITKRIGNLVDLSYSEKDHPTHNFLQWFLKEQVEEEATSKDMCDKMKLIGDSTEGLFMMDHDLASRTFSPDKDE